MANHVESCGSVFADLGFSPEEAALFEMRAELIACVKPLWRTVGRNEAA